ncbi:MAG: trypsin-like peptidase domain-containing protein [Anaerolineales bacterium]|nr:trypsin-like peptidase domain-containing protein [Anaerolineales bacterium]
MVSTILQNLSNDLAGIVKSAEPSLVRVEARRRLPATGMVWSADGVIVTAHHVVEREDNLKIGLADGQTVSATLVGRDPTTDLAVLRSEAKDLTPPAWAAFDAQGPQVGHLVLALGRPGQSAQATLGIISALGDQWRTPGGSQLDHYVQTDVVMYPGFSGGPLVNAAGEIIGLNTSALLRGISLTIPNPNIRQVVETLLAHGQIKRGYLGISTQPVRLPEALRQQLNQETGLLLAGVEPGSPAEKGGLLLGDTIVAVENEPIRQHDDLLAALSGDRVGQTVSIQVVRGGQLQNLAVTVGERS